MIYWKLFLCSFDNSRIICIFVVAVESLTMIKIVEVILYKDRNCPVWKNWEIELQIHKSFHTSYLQIHLTQYLRSFCQHFVKIFVSQLALNYFVCCLRSLFNRKFEFNFQMKLLNLVSIQFRNTSMDIKHFLPNFLYL